MSTIKILTRTRRKCGLSAHAPTEIICAYDKTESERAERELKLLSEWGDEVGYEYSLKEVDFQSEAKTSLTFAEGVRGGPVLIDGPKVTTS